jgi:hypothetical protein
MFKDFDIGTVMRAYVVGAILTAFCVLSTSIHPLTYVYMAVCLILFPFSFVLAENVRFRIADFCAGFIVTIGISVVMFVFRMLILVVIYMFALFLSPIPAAWHGICRLFARGNTEVQ